MTVRLTLLALLFLAAMSAGRPAGAHFVVDNRMRIIHVAHSADGLAVYMRVPFPLIVADRLGPVTEDGETPAPAPYTYNRIEGGDLMHYLDIAQLRADPDGLGALIAEGHGLFTAERRLPWTVTALRVHPVDEQPRFTTLAEARGAVAGPVFASEIEAIYAGEVVVDIALRIDHEQPLSRYWFSSRLAPDLEGADRLANMLIDHAGDPPRIYRAVGTLEQPIAVTLDAAPPTQAWYAVLGQFTWLGIVHILAGLDHVLFVLCLTVGALGLGNLLWRITGFTLGHTVTLSLGFFGIVPAGAWFVPTVELAIALSIIYVGAMVLVRRKLAATFLVTALIGLLHGFGFSFVLHTYLQVDAPHLWSSLLAFNIGVEIGQVAIILLAWTAMMVIGRRTPRYETASRAAVAIGCIAIAGYWTVERTAGLWGTLA